jgi:hypothetical protein
LRTGVYQVTFSQNALQCGLSISSAQWLGAGQVAVNPSVIDPGDSSHDFFTVVGDLSTANSVVVAERDADTRALANGPFTIVMFCA